MLKKLFHAVIAGVMLFGTAARAADDSMPTSYIHMTNLGSGSAADDSPPSSYAHITNLGTGGLVPSGLTQGSVIFAGAGGALSQDNSNLFYDATNHRLGIGTATPASVIDAMSNSVDANANFRLSNTAATSTGNTVNLQLLGLTTVQARQLVQLQGAWADNTDATRSAVFRINTAVSGVSAERFRIGANGNIGILNILPQANLSIGTTAATVRSYNSFTDAANGAFGYGAPDWSVSAGVATWGTGANGSAIGTVQKMQFVAEGVNKLDFGVTTTGVWAMNTAPGIGVASLTLSTSNSNDVSISYGHGAGEFVVGLDSASSFFFFSAGTGTKVLSIAKATGNATFGGIVNPNNSFTPTCGSGCSSITGNDQKFAVTTGTAQTSITVNFGHTWTAAPVCTVTSNSTASVTDISSTSTTTITFGASVALTGGIINVLCF